MFLGKNILFYTSTTKQTHFTLFFNCKNESEITITTYIHLRNITMVQDCREEESSTTVPTLLDLNRLGRRRRRRRDSLRKTKSAHAAVAPFGTTSHLGTVVEEVDVKVEGDKWHDVSCTASQTTNVHLPRRMSSFTASPTNKRPKQTTPHSVMRRMLQTQMANPAA
uniref:Uncharacterized protein n=1 Tax=Amphora coffeiformis TaxID=265554 RepID=A0A7S3LDY8_9STRA